MATDTIPARLFRQAATRPDHPALQWKEGGAYRPISFAGYAAEVRRMAKALIASGLPIGGKVGILGWNRPEWVIASVGTMAAGGAPAGLYNTLSSTEIEYILAHSEAPLCVVETAEHAAKVRDATRRGGLVCRVVAMRGANIDDPAVLAWDAFLASGDGVPDSAVDERVAAIRPDTVAELIYTSGTTGPPKAVMLTHDNLTWTADCAIGIVSAGPSDRSLSYLPLAHIAEQMFTIHVPISAGMTVYFAESLPKLPDNLREVQPTVFFGVPRIWEKFHAGITGKLAGASPTRKRLFGWATSVGARVNALRNRGKAPGGLLALQYRLANRLVFSKLREAIGLAKARVCVSGAAPIASNVLEFFASVDITVCEVYGQSEDTGPTSFNVPGRVRLGTVGQPIPGIEVRIADDGEILVRGRNVFLGYYKEPAATADTLVDGWMRSGDLGAFDAEGYLRITGRKKDILITAGGKNIAPRNIEEAILVEPVVEEVVVIGDRRKYLTALVTLSAEVLARDFGGLDQARAAEDPRVLAVVQKRIDLVNRDLASVETVKKFRCLPASFTIDTGELTPSLKVKRQVVLTKYAPLIDSMYT